MANNKPIKQVMKYNYLDSVTSSDENLIEEILYTGK
jgi:hypothetical protein